MVGARNHRFKNPLRWFSSPVQLGMYGAERVLDFGKLSPVEQKNFDGMIGELTTQQTKVIFGLFLGYFWKKVNF